MQDVDGVGHSRGGRGGSEFIDDLSFALGKGEEGFSIDGEKQETTLQRLLIHVGNVSVEKCFGVETRQADGSPRFCRLFRSLKTGKETKFRGKAEKRKQQRHNKFQ